jgi:hypothetical protein
MFEIVTIGDRLLKIPKEASSFRVMGEFEVVDFECRL